ncbi:carbonic anhydrase [Pseudoclavibacter chungangensis]|uniref:carbonic anhydrase n=1 Tax=Pseudoclavibacter chungangensis TaxID=587635 RepID=A0A7J5BQN2_9MICO|nr:carbonic anhydrase [Pseudoclavibacter chungangensis]KAB1656317.1 carbonic anhydrase [Pseudoclavibacter chungangensis]NYJ67083.1 carbonic anhydrase [Pseudoclavibacter chungangensis]
MSVIDELLEHNHEYVASYTGDKPLRPSKRLAVVACMDSRLDIFAMLGLDLGEAHIIRNAGGVITDDVIRSLTISQRMLGTEAILLIHHTNCGLSTFTEDEFDERLLAETGARAHWKAESFRDVDVSVRESIRRITQSPFVAHTDNVRGFVFDVETGELREVSRTADAA